MVDSFHKFHFRNMLPTGTLISTSLSKTQINAFSLPKIVKLDWNLS